MKCWYRNACLVTEIAVFKSTLLLFTTTLDVFLQPVWSSHLDLRRLPSYYTVQTVYLAAILVEFSRFVLKFSLCHRIA